MITAAALINSFILALISTERWQAARQLKHGFMTKRWFITVMVMILFVIAILPFAISYYRRKAKQQKLITDSSANQAAKTEPSEHENQIQEA